MIHTKTKFRLLLPALVSLIISVLLFSELNHMNINASINSIKVTGTYNDTEAKVLLDNINRDRTSGGGFYYDSNNKQVPAVGLCTLQYNNNLAKIARERAAELAVSYSYTRPSGESFTTCTSSGIRSYQEFIYKDTTVRSGSDMYGVWFKVGRGEAAPSMMNPIFQTVAAARFTFDGTTYWVLELSCDYYPAVYSYNNNGEDTFYVKYDTSRIGPTYKISNPTTKMSGSIGDTLEIPLNNTNSLLVYRGAVYESTYSFYQYSITYSTNDKNGIFIAANNVGRFTLLKAGTYKVKMTYTVNSTVVATNEITVTCNTRTMKDVKMETTPVVTYTGKEIKDLDLKLVCNGIRLEKGTDYTITGTKNNVNVTNKAVVTVKGTGIRVTGTQDFNFTIETRKIDDATITSSRDNTEFTDATIDPDFKVVVDGITLVKDKDYYYAQTIFEPKSYSITIYGKGNYSGKKDYVFTVTKYTLKDEDVSSIEDQIYTGNPLTPEITVKANNKVIDKKNYKVYYENNTDAGTATVTVSIDNSHYTGVIKKTFTIKKYAVSDSQVSTIDDKKLYYSGEYKTPKITVVALDRTLKQDTDYVITYEDNFNAGSATATITMINNYSGTFTRRFTISPYPVIASQITVQPQIYTGKEIIPDILIVASHMKLVENTDYIVTYSNNVEVGVATATIEMIGNFCGKFNIDFEILSDPSLSTNDNSDNSSNNESSTVNTPTPTVKPTSTPVPTKAPELNVGDFIERCYEISLGRNADMGGFDYWTRSLTNGEICGVQAAYGFIFSPEYLQKSTSNECFVTDLYLMFFDREPDKTGYSYWVDMLNNNQASRETVFAGFANSIEFNALCNQYGVVSGYYVVGLDINQQSGINSFVARLYKVCLNRLPDQGGQAGWVQKLLSGETTGTDCSYGFVFSPEFVELELSNEDYVSYMYRAFFGREADKEGLTYWVNLLYSGTTSRLDVFNGFAGSIEFDALCLSYGIHA